MTIANISNLSTQVVTKNSSSSGGAFGATALVVQLVQQNEPGRLLASSLTTQVIQQSIPQRLLTSFLNTQVVHQNGASSGGIFRMSHQSPQIIFSVGAPDTERQLAWTMDFDGHTFYCLDLGTSGCIVYDTTTKSWSKWTTTGYDGHFNFKNGFHWRDGKQIVGGSLLDGWLLRMEEDTFIDEGFKPVSYEIQGVIFTSTEDYIRQYNLRMVGSPGRRALDGEFDAPTMKMQFSDDNGATWSTERSVALTSDKSQRIEFRSLGAMRQPGRIFRLYDEGGIKFVAYVMADMEGE